MKKFICFCMMILFFYCFAENRLDKKLFNDFDRITWDFKKNELREYIYTQDDFIKNTYQYFYNAAEPYDELILENSEKKENYIVLFPENEDFLLLYGTGSDKAIHHGFLSKDFLFYISDCTYKASSCMNENGIVYVAENLGSTDLYKPWIEGNVNSGIGEKIEISSKKRQISTLVISNGFVSRKKETYFNNNRVKGLKITNKKNVPQVQEITLTDTATPIEYKLQFPSNEIELEIISVYEGEKFNDTCVNFILCKGE